jgi:sugar phosphate isomerase/epimerase
LTDPTPIYWSPHGGIARGWPPEKIFDTIAEVGYAGTEIWMDPRWLDWNDPNDVKRIKQEASRRNLETSTICWRRFEDREPTNPAHAEAARQYLLDCLRVGEACGSDTVLCYPGVPAGVDYDTAWKTCREVMGSLAGACRDAGISIAIEFESPGPVLLGTPEQTLQFIAEAGDHVSACADTYHLHNRGIDQREGVRQLKGHMTLAHLSDSDRQTPGKGAVDFPRFFEGLRDIGYDGRLFIQCGPTDESEFRLAFERAREWAKLLRS